MQDMLVSRELPDEPQSVWSSRRFVWQFAHSEASRENPDGGERRATDAG
jgi:hypothetical protein